VTWQFRYIAGHQDRQTTYNNLDRRAQFNVEADHLAKGHLSLVSGLTPYFDGPHEAWLLWFKGEKLLKPSSTIYEIVHGEEGLSYWSKMDKCNRRVLDYVAWDAIGAALQSSRHSLGHLSLNTQRACVG